MSITDEYKLLRNIPGVGLCGLQRMIFTTGLFVGINDIGYVGRYCYESYSDALQALEQWDGIGDPPGPWIKWKSDTGSRSNHNLKED